MTELVNQLGRGWLEYFALAVVQNTLFLGLVLLILQRLRNAPANVKYVIGLVGLLKLLLPPFLRLPAVTASASEPTTLSQLVSLVPFGRLPLEAAGEGSAVATFDWAGALFVVWGATALVVLAGSVVSTVRLTARLSGGRPVDSGLVPRELLRKGIEVYQTDCIALPLTLGVFPRKVFVPDTWTEWTAERRRMVLRHELAHIDRRDGLAKILQIVARSLYFFHPLVLMLDRRLNEYREMACDDASLKPGETSSLEYAKHLVEIADSVVPQSLQCEPASTLIRHKNELLKRVRYQLKEGKMQSMSKLKGAMILLAMALMVLPLSWYRGNAAPGDFATASMQSDEKAKAKQAQEAKAKEKAKKAQAAQADMKHVFIKLQDDGTVLVDKKKTEMAKLPKILDYLAAGDTDHTVINLMHDDDVTAGAFYKVQQMLVERGLEKVKFVQAEGKDLALVLPPTDVMDKLKKIDKKDLIKVSVDAEGQALLDGKKVADEKLVKKLAYRLQENPHLIVMLRADSEARYSDMTRVLGLLKKADLPRIVVYPALEG